MHNKVLRQLRHIQVIPKQLVDHISLTVTWQKESEFDVWDYETHSAEYIRQWHEHKDSLVGLLFLRMSNIQMIICICFTCGTTRLQIDGYGGQTQLGWSVQTTLNIVRARQFLLCKVLELLEKWVNKPLDFEEQYQKLKMDSEILFNQLQIRVHLPFLTEHP